MDHIPASVGKSSQTTGGKQSGASSYKRSSTLYCLYRHHQCHPLRRQHPICAAELLFPDDPHHEVLVYVTNRLGVLSFANMPLIYLYAGRNNILLLLTDWSHATFILLHRWFAYIATLQAVLHSAIYLHIYVAEGQHASESKLPYWYWGIIATLGMTILLPTSIKPVRDLVYESFLVWHIALSVLVLVGCYLHIYDRFEHQWGYEVWIFAAIAVWGFDRILRLLRLARNGICTAEISVIDEDYIRINIRGVVATGHVYLYFPALTWRIWENHPFSVASTLLPSLEHKIDELPGKDLERNGEGSYRNSDEKITATSQIFGYGIEGHQAQQPPSLGLTFFLRTRSGLTSLLPRQGSVHVLVESTYGGHEDLSGYPMLICIAGGVGITAVMPFLQSHPGSKKLYWGVRNDGIVKAMEASLSGINKEIFIGKRMALRDVMDEAARGSGPIDVAVVVSGPSSMADETRMLVSEFVKKSKRCNIKLVEESFAW